jgi:sugar lactone lactonase YvrE
MSAPRVLTAELVLESRARIGECPVWDARIGRLAWIDILGPSVHLFDPSSGIDERFELDQHVGAVAPRASGGYVLALREGFATLDLERGIVEIIHEVGGRAPDVRLNDGRCDSSGRFWAGSVADDLRGGAAALYRLDPDHRAYVVRTGITISNGMDWSPDGRAMYYIDSASYTVDRYRFDDHAGSISDPDSLVRLSPDLGMPDGMAVDSEGYLWVAVFRGSAVHRYTPDGVLDTVVKLPVTLVTSCGFGGRNLDDLYITSAMDHLSPAERLAEPLAGSLFRCRPGVRGRPVHAYAG